MCREGSQPPLLQLNHNEPPKPVVQCSDHMCPIAVHWHIKQSYTHYWRVKVTVRNFNFVKNYSDWNLVVMHPNLRSVEQVFSFNYKPLNVYGNISEHINSFNIFLQLGFYKNKIKNNNFS